MDYRPRITELLPKITDEKVIHRIWLLLEYAYIDEINVKPKKPEKVKATA